MKTELDITQNIGSILKSIRKRQHLPKSMVERNTGISRNTIRRIESGETPNPGTDTVFKLLDFYGVNIYLGYKMC